jgi:hypothetical protein
VNGFIYQITTEDYFLPFLVSVQSLREHHTEPVAVVLSKNVWHLDPRIVPGVFMISSSFDLHGLPRYVHFRHKFLTYHKTPFRRTIYLDCDTIVKGNIGRLWTDGLTLTRLDSGIINAGVIGFGLNAWPFFDACKRYVLEHGLPRLTWGDQPAINHVAKCYPLIDYVDDSYNRCNHPHSSRSDWLVRHLHGLVYLQDAEWQRRKNLVFNKDGQHGKATQSSGRKTNQSATGDHGQVATA